MEAKAGIVPIEFVKPLGLIDLQGVQSRVTLLVKRGLKVISPICRQQKRECTDEDEQKVAGERWLHREKLNERHQPAITSSR